MEQSMIENIRSDCVDCSNHSRKDSCWCSIKFFATKYCQWITQWTVRTFGTAFFKYLRNPRWRPTMDGAHPVAHEMMFVSGMLFFLEIVLQARYTDSPLVSVSRRRVNNNYWHCDQPLMKRTYARSSDSFPGKVDTSNCKLNSVVINILLKVSSTFSAISSTLRWTELSLRGIDFMTCSGDLCKTVLITTSTADRISFSPIVWGFPAFTINKEML